MTVEELLEKYAAGVRDFNNIELCEANLSGAKLKGINLHRANLSIINFSGANLLMADLSYAKLNVARLRGANLSRANLNGASLNVANLIRADLSYAELIKASLIRAELIRADLSHANLLQANLTSADLRETTLRQANLRCCNLSQATLRDALLTGANLSETNLYHTDLSRAEISGANFRNAELRQTNFSRANLSGANLSGANLRWANLSGANLSWADLTGVKLSGASLIGADLSNANLTNASLVHADLSEANLIKAEWVGADLTGANLTGVKIYAVSRFGLKTEAITCEWVDLSPTGDRTIIQKFSSDQSREFFNEAPPTVQIIVDRPLDYEANFALSSAYYYIAQQYRKLKQPPSLEIGRRRTVLTFRVDSDENLFATAYMTIFPFKDASITQKSISQMMETIFQENSTEQIKLPDHTFEQLTSRFGQVKAYADGIIKSKNNFDSTGKLFFFQAPTQTILTNSSAQTLILYDNPHFGKRLINPYDPNVAVDDNLNEAAKFVMPSSNILIDFVNGFHYGH